MKSTVIFIKSLYYRYLKSERDLHANNHMLFVVTKSQSSFFLDMYTYTVAWTNGLPFLSGFVQRLTSLIESFVKVFAGSMNCTIWSIIESKIQ